MFPLKNYNIYLFLSLLSNRNFRYFFMEVPKRVGLFYGYLLTRFRHQKLFFIITVVILTITLQVNKTWFLTKFTSTNVQIKSDLQSFRVEH